MMAPNRKASGVIAIDMEKESACSPMIMIAKNMKPKKLKIYLKARALCYPKIE
jgi:hypothetical protein